jgi:hypothetical protein
LISRCPTNAGNNPSSFFIHIHLSHPFYLTFAFTSYLLYPPIYSLPSPQPVPFPIPFTLPSLPGEFPVDAVVFFTDADVDALLSTTQTYLNPRHGAIVQTTGRHVHAPVTVHTYRTLDVNTLLLEADAVTLTEMTERVTGGLEKRIVVPLPVKPFQRDQLREAFATAGSQQGLYTAVVNVS